MLVTVFPKYGRANSKVESFGNFRYLVYLLSVQGLEADKELILIMSRQLGVPASRVNIKSRGSRGEVILETL